MRAGRVRARASLIAAALVLSVSAAAQAAVPVERVSVDARGIQGNGHSGTGLPAISGDGRLVAFESQATNLLRGSRVERTDIYLRDRRERTLRRLVKGAREPRLSRDGRRLAFTREFGVLELLDRRSGSVSTVTVGSDGRTVHYWSDDRPAMSPDARYFAFSSFDKRVVAGDTDNRIDVFVRDRVRRVTTRESVTVGGGPASGDSRSPDISDDGRFVAFGSDARNLVAGDTNGQGDVFVRDRVAGTTTRVSVATGGAQATGSSDGPSISPDGRYVLFASDATDLVAGDDNGETDVFLHDRATGTTTRVSVTTAGEQANGGSFSPDFLHGSRLIEFASNATNLVSGDTNAQFDVFVRNLATGVTARASLGASATPPETYPVVVSADGRLAAFATDAADLVRGDTNRRLDVFVAGPLEEAPWAP